MNAVIMENLKKITALNAFNPYLRLIKSYNFENFERNDQSRYVKNVCFVSILTTFIALMPIICALAIWYIIDNGGAMRIVVVVVPPTLTVLQLLVTFITLTAKIRVVSETIDRIQNVVDERE